jgi:effector-binding domain-containing protein
MIQQTEMIETPQITSTQVQVTAVIRLTIPRAEMRTVVGPAIKEVMTTVAAQAIAPSGPWFIYQFRMDPEIFDFEIGVPVASPVTASGRVRPSQLRAATVARTVYHGPYEGLPGAWGDFSAWIEAQGHTSAADLWECYVVGPESGLDPANWRTELTRPLTS